MVSKTIIGLDHGCTEKTYSSLPGIVGQNGLEGSRMSS